jgi:drug/metabolite transporter (DMT)-like permease
VHALAITLWMANVVLDTVGQLVFKAAAADPAAGTGVGRWRRMLARPWLPLGGLCYVMQFIVWIAFLSLVPLSEGILLASVNIVLIMLAGRYLFGERLTRIRVTGILLVSFGVAIVGAN